MPEWRNWQTRLPQKQVFRSVGSSPTLGTICGFSVIESANLKQEIGLERNQIFFDFLKNICYNIYRKLRKECLYELL